MKGPFKLLDERFSITKAAAPSDTIEQSERFKGGATTGFFSEACLQNSKLKSFRRWANGFSVPFL